MSKYSATIIWQRGKDEKYIDNKYSRGHEWSFDGGISIPASASPKVVPLPYSIEENIDPAEAFIASIASCHMLYFLSIAAKMNFIVDEYIDNPVGVLENDNEGFMAITKVILNPKVKFYNNMILLPKEIDEIHNKAHQKCFLVNSIKTHVIIKKNYI
jgi:organic hydroperoxide reductase OsmC/OhrA